MEGNESSLPEAPSQRESQGLDAREQVEGRPPGELGPPGPVPVPGCVPDCVPVLGRAGGRRGAPRAQRSRASPGPAAYGAALMPTWCQRAGQSRSCQGSGLSK